ncbi:hypothetical protein BU24DRAFT_355098 [Aaosphaeria arxii CBS 175.79]|uniref:Transcription initiation factor TFIID subunit 4 n=1 Tax=Aaosphaeria arxii CBS 175.79 TaxID=1450172 RepID=A0A6A5XE21_9PLEO|nr:uncharacterized protein BU24DRAFT_355098 [Aaosphaeria arxii CBS 175.79]KAF2011149.1 hypothetical protein BU24DRAFT_355098 [Aaosphaeria arxii CBS 175.79]
MASPYSNPYGHSHQNQATIPPLQTNNLPPQQQPTQRPFSPPSYQQSPGAMSPSMGIPPAKRQRLSPNPPSPYQSPFSAPSYGNTSPYAAGSPPVGHHASLPQSPAAGYPSHSFHQPQPYPHANDSNLNARPPPGAMPPPKVPYSKAQNDGELEKANPRDMDVNNISDVLTGSGIDLRAEEDNLLHTFRNQTYGNSFNSQASGSTLSPHGSFNNWSQGANGAGAFQGAGPLSQPVTKEQQEAELARKHSQAARAYAEVAQAPLADPFLHATQIRQRISTRVYEHGLKLNLEGLFDKIPDTPQNVTRASINGSDGESVAALQADSLLNHGAPFVDILSLISLAAEERLRSVLEDAFTLSQGRQNSSHGVVPPALADIAIASAGSRQTTAVPTNISKTAWEAPDSAISPLTVTTDKKVNAARLPTPPTEAPPTPQPTISLPNHIANALKRKVTDDYKWEEARLAKRKKRLQAASGAPAETPTAAPIQLPDKITKKEQMRMAKAGQTEDVLHRKANETASMALGGKKKYSWMTGGGGGGGGGGASGTSTPSRINTSAGSASGASTPAQVPVDRALVGLKRTYGGSLETGDPGKRLQVRDIIHVLHVDGKERKTLATVLARLKNVEKDEEKKPTSSVR